MLKHACLALGAAVIVASAIAIGPGGAMSSLMPRDPIEARILSDVRVPRVALGFLAGAALATAGMAFQALFRNALATPFTLGVSAGAALGAMLAITFGWSFAWAGIPAAPAASFAGSLIAVGIVYALARGRRRGLSTHVLLLDRFIPHRARPTRGLQGRWSIVMWVKAGGRPC